MSDETCDDDCGSIGSDFEFKCYCTRCKRERSAADEIARLGLSLIDLHEEIATLGPEASKVPGLEGQLDRSRRDYREAIRQRDFWKAEAAKKVPSKRLWNFLRTGEMCFIFALLIVASPARADTAIGASNVAGFGVEGWPSILGYEVYAHPFSRVENWLAIPGWWPETIDGTLWIQMGSADALVVAPLPLDYADMLEDMAWMGWDRGASSVQFIYPPPQREAWVSDTETNTQRLEQVAAAIDAVCAKEEWMKCAADLSTLPATMLQADGLHLTAEGQEAAAIVVPEPGVTAGLVVSLLTLGGLRVARGRRSTRQSEEHRSTDRRCGSVWHRRCGRVAAER